MSALGKGADSTPSISLSLLVVSSHRHRPQLDYVERGVPAVRRSVPLWPSAGGPQTEGLDKVEIGDHYASLQRDFCFVSIRSLINSTFDVEVEG